MPKAVGVVTSVAQMAWGRLRRTVWGPSPEDKFVAAVLELMSQVGRHELTLLRGAVLWGALICVALGLWSAAGSVPGHRAQRQRALPWPRAPMLHAAVLLPSRRTTASWLASTRIAGCSGGRWYWGEGRLAAAISDGPASRPCRCRLQRRLHDEL